MTGARSYGNPCGLALALDAVGERWALLIVRELAYGPRRFTDLRATLGASPNVLTQRLDEMVDTDVVDRSSASGAQYQLTDRGRALHPTLVQLARWGLQAAGHPTGEPSAATLMLALEARFHPIPGSGSPASVEIRLQGERFSVTVRDHVLSIVRAHSPAPDAVIETDVAALQQVVLGRERPGPGIRMRGDVALATRLLSPVADP